MQSRGLQKRILRENKELEKVHGRDKIRDFKIKIL